MQDSLGGQNTSPDKNNSDQKNQKKVEEKDESAIKEE